LFGGSGVIHIEDTCGELWSRLSANCSSG